MTRHIERKRNISNKVYMRFFGLRPLNDTENKSLYRTRHCEKSLILKQSSSESVNVGYFILGFMQPQSPHQIFFLFYCEEKRKNIG